MTFKLLSWTGAIALLLVPASLPAVASQTVLLIASCGPTPSSPRPTTSPTPTPSPSPTPSPRR